MVLYCAPLFHTYDEFSRYFAAGAIWLNTKWIHLNDFTTIRGKVEHCITYSRRGPTRQRSEPVDGRGSDGEEFLSDLVQAVKKYAVEINVNYLRHLWDTLNDVIREVPSAKKDLEYGGWGSDLRDPREMLRAVRSLVRVEFGAELFVVAEANESLSH